MKNLIVLLVIALSSSYDLFSQTCCSGGIPLSNNIGLETLEKGAIQIGVNYDFNNLNTLKSESETLDDNSRLRTTHSVLINFGYSITNNLSVESLLTWVNQRRIISQFGNKNLDETTGIGDGVVLIKYKFNNILGDFSSANIGAGAKIPLGSSTETNDQGITYNADLQPGSSAWDAIFLSQFAKSFGFRPSLNISSRLIYRITGTNDSYFGNSDYKFGNEFQVFLNFTDQFTLFKTLARPTVSFKYRDANKDRTNGFELENTGGNWFWVIPRFAINITKQIQFLSSIEIPFYSKVDGTQVSPTYRITSGLLFQFLPRESFDLNTI